MNIVNLIWKYTCYILGACTGWLIAEFEPTFPLIIVAVVFILFDAYTAYDLDKRAHAMYPTKAKRKQAKFTSFAFGKVIRTTIPKRLCVILLAYIAEKYVFLHIDLPLSYILTGVICFEQAWSILENESSCRDEHSSKFWRILQRVMIDKTERHFDVNLDELKHTDKVTEEQVEAAREILLKYEKMRKEAAKEATPDTEE